LLQSLQQNAKREFDTYNLHPKHIKVTEINATTAVALYYVEGTYQQKESGNNDNYLTRVMQVYVKEEGGWKIRAAHWSPLTGGKGTTETAIKQ
jgi:ketosteroid isomerase-like protein